MSTNGQEPDADSVASAEEEEDLTDRPLKVTSIIISGGKLETRENLVKRELTGLIDAATVGDVLKAADKAIRNLEALDIYDRVQIVLDEGKEVRWDRSLSHFDTRCFVHGLELWELWGVIIARGWLLLLPPAQLFLSHMCHAHCSDCVSFHGLLW